MVKKEAWCGRLEDSSNTRYDRKLWRVLKSVNGTPENNPTSLRSIMTNLLHQTKGKLNFFKHYAGVSKINMSKEDRTENKNL